MRIFNFTFNIYLIIIDFLLQCLVFEDAPNGVQAAVSAGMQVIMVPESFVPPEQRLIATKVLNSLMEFKPEEFGLPKFQL